MGSPVNPKYPLFLRDIGKCDCESNGSESGVVGGYPVVTIEDNFTIEVEPNIFYDIKNEIGVNINLIFNDELEFNDKLNSYLFKINSPCNIYINKELFWNNKEIPDFTKNCIYYIQIDNDIASYKTITANIDIPNNQLWYKTCNNKIADFTNPEFQQNIVSHVYEYNKGIVTFDSDLTVLPDGLFYENQYISYIEIPQSVISIGGSSLGMCNLVIKNIINHSNVNTNDNNYFGATIYDKEENNLLINNNIIENIRLSATYILVPKYVIGLDTYKFNNIATLESIKVHKDNIIFTDDDCNAIINKNEKSLLLGCANTKIPDYIKTIKHAAFYNANAYTIIIPNNIETIESYAFSNSKFVYITISENITIINGGVFSHCSNLKTINLNNITDIKNSAFLNCSNLETINLNNINKIEKDAFKNCIKLTNVTLSNSISYLDEEVFSCCNLLTSINLPSTITYIGARCFENCDLRTVVIPDNVKTIEKSCFKNNYNLTELIIPKSVTKIDYAPFSGCAKLLDITYNGTIQEFKSIIGFDSLYDGTERTIHCTDGDITLPIT